MLDMTEQEINMTQTYYDRMKTDLQKEIDLKQKVFDKMKVSSSPKELYDIDQHRWDNQRQEMMQVHPPTQYTQAEHERAADRQQRPNVEDRGSPLKWSDIDLSANRKAVHKPRVRLFYFIITDPCIRKDKYGIDRHEYCFSLCEYMSDDNPEMMTQLVTAAKGLLGQINQEIDRYYGSGEFFKRMYLLLREGEGYKTMYTLRGFDSERDAHEAYDACIEQERMVR